MARAVIALDRDVSSVRTGASRRRLGPPVVYVTLLVGALVGQSAWLVARFGLRWTNEDQTLLWYASREISRGRWHQPHFYGQRYGSVLEAVPAVLISWLGVSIPTAQVVASAVLATLPWLLLGAATWRRSPVWAATVLAIPPLLTTELRIVSLAPRGFAVSPLLASVAVAVLVRSLNSMSPRRLAVVVASALAAASLDQTCAIVVVPALVLAWWQSVGHASLRARVAAVLVGAAPAAAWEIFGAAFYRTRVDYDLFSRQTSFRPSWDSLVRNVRRIEGGWRYLAPDLVHDGRVPVVVTIGIVGLVVVRAFGANVRGRSFFDRWGPSGAAMAMLGVIGAILASPRAERNFPLYVHTSRLFLTLPMALWFVAYTSWALQGSAPAPHDHGVGRRRWTFAAALVAVVLVVLVTLAVRAPGAPARLDARMTQELVIEPRRTSEVRQTCAALAVAARQAPDPLIVFWSDPALDYGCAALERLPTLFGPLERRAWRTRDEEVRRRSAMLMWGWPPRCSVVPAGVSCRVLDFGTDLIELRFPSQPALDVVRAMNGSMNASQP